MLLQEELSKNVVKCKPVECTQAMTHKTIEDNRLQLPVIQEQENSCSSRSKGRSLSRFIVHYLIPAPWHFSKQVLFDLTTAISCSYLCHKSLI